MPKLHLTDRVVRSLSTAKAQEDIYDSYYPGFGVRVNRTGRRRFFVRYRANGRQRRLDLGPYPEISLAEARNRARGALGDVARDLDPAGDRALKKEGPTFRELADQFIERYAKKRKRTWHQDVRKIQRDLLPSWGPRKAVDIQKADVIQVLDAVVDRGSPGAANRLLALIRKIFNWGLERDLVERNPCAGLKPPAPNRSRDRLLSEAEVSALWWVLEEEIAPVQAAIRILLLTGQRSIEVLSMRWQDLDGALWRIPAEVVKGKRPHAVPLSPQVQQILAGQRELTDGQWVIASPRLADRRLDSGTLSRTPHRLRERLGFDWWVHDLRRTAASHMAALGVNRFVIRQVLNHADPSVTAIYDRHSYLPEMRQALEVWGRRVEEIVAAGRSEQAGGLPWGRGASSRGRA